MNDNNKCVKEKPFDWNFFFVWMETRIRIESSNVSTVCVCVCLCRSSSLSSLFTYITSYIPFVLCDVIYDVCVCVCVSIGGYLYYSSQNLCFLFHFVKAKLFFSFFLNNFFVFVCSSYVFKTYLVLCTRITHIWTHIS